MWLLDTIKFDSATTSLSTSNEEIIPTSSEAKIRESPAVKSFKVENVSLRSS